MTWKKDDEFSITFSCDTCPEQHRVAGGNFIEASAAVSASGWISLKRQGFAWTNHCARCSAQAERDHEEHKRQEAARDRLKARNERS
jgi:hypothetical protein